MQILKFFGDISLVLPNDFDINNFKKLKVFKKIKINLIQLIQSIKF